MSWNYRVMKFTDEDNEDYYELKEVYYNRDGTLMGYCDATVSADSVVAIIDVLNTMKEDAHKAVLTEDDFHA